VTTQRYLADSVAPGPVYAVEFSPDGTRVATGSGDGSARVFDAASGAEICRLDHDRWVRAVAFSPDGTRLATSSSDGSARMHSHMLVDTRPSRSQLRSGRWNSVVSHGRASWAMPCRKAWYSCMRRAVHNVPKMARNNCHDVWHHLWDIDQILGDSVARS